MRLNLLRRTGVVIAVLAATTALGVTAADAQPVTNGSLSFSGDPGEYISGGASHSYSTADNDILAVEGDPADSHIHVTVNGANGDRWTLDLVAPSGQTLAAGTYSNATLYPWQDPSVPGLAFAGDNRFCDTANGSFVIQDVVFGPQGYVQTLDATYVQYCDASTAALRGEVHFANPSAPPALSLGLTVSTTGTVSKLDGNAYISGQLTCSEASSSVSVGGEVTEVAHDVIIRAGFTTTVACTPDAPVDWTAAAVPTGTTPFQKGQAVVDGTIATAHDPVYDDTAETSAPTTVVKLTATKTPS